MHRRFSNRNKKPAARRASRLRTLLFDSLEDRRLMAGLTIFVYDDADQSGTWQQASEAVLKEHVVFLDQDNNGKLGVDEASAVTDTDGRAVFNNLSTGQAIVRLFGSSAPATPITINDVADILTANLAGAARPGNRAPVLGSIPSQSVDEDGELDLAASLLAEAATDADGDALAYFLAGSVSKGSLSWSVDDGGKYKPNANYFGDDSIFIRAFDGSAWSDPVKLDIVVKSVDDAPTAVKFDGGSIPENEAGYVLGDFSLEDIDGGSYAIEITPEGLFEIKDGKLKLLDGVSLDFEATPTIEMTITVVTPGIPLSSSYSIPVINRNDAPTTISIDGLLRVEEFKTGYEFGFISVVDQDVGETYSFSTDDARFEVADGIFKLKPGAMLVFADAPSVTLTVTATSDSNGAQITSEVDIEVVRAAPPWQNKHWAFDVNDDGELGPIDVLVVINALNRMGLARLDRLPPPGSTSFIDVNGDRQLTPLDALILINALNRQQNSQGSGNGSGPPPPTNGGNGSGGGLAGGEGEGEANETTQSPSSPQRMAGPNSPAPAAGLSTERSAVDFTGNVETNDPSNGIGIRRGSRRLR